PRAQRTQPIVFGAPAAQRWQEANREVWLLTGGAFVRQGNVSAQAARGVVWLELGRYGERTGHVTAYLEEDVVVERFGDNNEEPDRLTDSAWMGTFESSVPLDIRVASVGAEPTTRPPVYRNALEYRNRSEGGPIQRAQFVEE